MDHSIIAMGFLFFVLSLSVCIVCIHKKKIARSFCLFCTFRINFFQKLLV